MQVKLPPSTAEQRKVVLTVSKMDPLQIRPSYQGLRLVAEVGPDGIAEFHGVPMGPALTLELTKNYPAFEYHQHGVVQASPPLAVQGIAAEWERIRVPASGFLALAAPSETSVDLEVTVLGMDGEPSVAGVIARRGWKRHEKGRGLIGGCLLYTSPSPRDQRGSRMPSSA